MEQKQDRKAAVIGAGLVGCLAAAMLAKQGWTVDLYESRADPRQVQKTTERARSINLALSPRGINALKAVDQDFAQAVLKGLIPMKGRMVHTRDGQKNSQAYGINGEAINSISRTLLNNSLLDEIEKMPSVSLRFKHKLLRADYEAGKLTFSADGESWEEVVDFVVGCDGAYSKVREQLMRAVRMDFRQFYIPDVYLELSLPPGPVDPVTKEATFSLEPDHLHIWPHHKYMLIALANEDKSFTCTLFAPFDTFATLKTNEEILTFFRNSFPDALPLIGEEELLRCFAENPQSPLITVECYPYHHKDKVVVIGDAAHSMVPFYGQGMNCGFEDVRVLQRHLLAYPTLSEALAQYSITRQPSLKAIQKLALDNYTEMASKVVNPLYLLRKKTDSLLTRILGEKIWCPLYTMVTFRDDLMYSEVIEREEWQQKVLSRGLGVFGASLLAGIGFGVMRYLRR